MQYSVFSAPPLAPDDKELALWILAMGETDQERVETMEELLMNARRDGMSDEDQTLVKQCIIALRENTYRFDGLRRVVAKAPQKQKPSEQDEDGLEIRFP